VLGERVRGLCSRNHYPPWPKPLPKLPISIQGGNLHGFAYLWGLNDPIETWGVSTLNTIDMGVI
jgi:hypothetical protein